MGLCGGATGRSAVPSGASTGAFEAVELRDRELPRHGGRGVKKAVEHVNNDISFLLDGKNALNQVEIDQLMIREDGTKNKGRFGANAILGVSMAVAKAAAKQLRLPLYQYLGGAGGSSHDEHYQWWETCGQQSEYSGVYDYAGGGDLISRLSGVVL